MTVESICLGSVEGSNGTLFGAWTVKEAERLDDSP